MTNRFGRGTQVRQPRRVARGTPPDEPLLLNSPSELDEWDLGLREKKYAVKANYGSFLNERERSLD